MNIFKRALINIGANKGKTLLLFVIFFTSMFAITMNNIVNETYDKLLEEAFPDGDVPVYVSPVYSTNIFGGYEYEMGDEKNIKPEMYTEMGNLEMVSRMEKRMNAYLYDIGYEVVEGSYDKSASVEFNDDLNNYGEKQGYKLDYDQNLFLTGERPVLVNDEFLENNNLSVGDKLTLDFSAEAMDEEGALVNIEELKTMEYTIVGTYHFEPTQEMIDQEVKWAEEYKYEPDLSFAFLKNTILMPIKNGEEIINIANENGADGSRLVYSSYTLYLNELSSISDFKKAASKVAGFDVDVDVDFYSGGDTDYAALESILTARYTIQGIFVGLIVIVVIMLAIIAIILVRGRRKEIGILVALGERRKKIYFQIVFEQTIVMIISTLIAFPAANIALRAVANKYAEVQLPFVITPLLLSLLAGLVIVLVSTLIPAIYTMRVNPKKILL